MGGRGRSSAIGVESECLESKASEDWPISPYNYEVSG